MSPEVRKRIEERATRLALWWPILSEPYEGLISRTENASSDPGFDTDPRTKPCEHRLEWRRANLCLACGEHYRKPGWRPLTREERHDKMGVDPYSAELSAGITIVRDESPSSRRARESERVNAEIATLQRNVRIRAGAEVHMDRATSTFLRVERKPHTVQRILKGMDLLRILRPSLWEALPDRDGFLALATVMYHAVPGNITAPHLQEVE